MLSKVSYVFFCSGLRRWSLLLLTPLLLLMLALALFGQIRSARAAALTVCAEPGGSYATIQGAVNAAVAGDVIQICAGTYVESVDLGAMAAPGDLTLMASGAVVITASQPALYLYDDFPGSITLVNIDAHSSGAEAVSLFGNLAGGLVITGGSMSSLASRGLYVGGSEGPVIISGASFSGSSSAGAVIYSQVMPPGCGAQDVPTPDVVRLASVIAGANGGDGVAVEALYGNIVVQDSLAEGNARHGFSLSSLDPCRGSRIVVRSSRADRNGSVQWGYGSGFALRGYNIAVQDSSAAANAYDGVEQTYGGLGLLSAAGSGSTDSGSLLDMPAVPAGAAAPAAIADRQAMSWTVAISNTTVAANLNHGIQVGAVDLVTIANISAISNTAAGIHLPYAEPWLGFGAVGAEPSAMTAVIADSLIAGNSVGIELNDELPQYGFSADPAAAGIAALAGSNSAGSIAGSIICANTSVGLAATGSVSHTFDAASNYWGSSTGPFHVANNPAGAGNQVVDAASPSTFPDANGDVAISPWVSGGASAVTPAAGAVGRPQEVSVFFRAGALPGITRNPGDPNGGALFMIATDNGALTTTLGSGAAAPATIGAGGALTATLMPARTGSATLTVSGPCGLHYTVVVPVIAPSVAVTKSAGVDPDACAAPGPVTVPVAGAVYYCLNVANTGNVTLTNHLVTDAQLGISNVPVTYTLAPGASFPITRSLISALGPIALTRSLTNVAAITSTAVFTEIGGIVVDPEVIVTVQSAGAVRVTAQPTGLDPIGEPATGKRLYLPALGR